MPDFAKSCIKRFPRIFLTEKVLKARSSCRSEATRIGYNNNTHQWRVESDRCSMCCVLFQFQFLYKRWTKVFYCGVKLIMFIRCELLFLKKFNKVTLKFDKSAMDYINGCKIYCYYLRFDALAFGLNERASDSQYSSSFFVLILSSATYTYPLYSRFSWSLPGSHFFQ